MSTSTRPRRRTRRAASSPRSRRPLDVAIVGAGPAGIGVACALRDAGVKRVAVLERGRVGASLRAWPRETRCITPSFQANGFGAVDLNAIAPGTSPAFSLDVEHPSGAEWADYLAAVAEHFRLPVREQTTVTAVHTLPSADGFTLETSGGMVSARCVVWAAGEFATPRRDLFPGEELCRHVSTVPAFAEVETRDVLVIGGYESGIDAAVALLERPDRHVTVLDRSAPWERHHEDPSGMLSPYTRARLQHAQTSGRLTLAPDADVVAASRLPDGGVSVATADGRTFTTSAPPLLATGYRPTLSPIGHLLERDADGMPQLDERDQSTLAPGLFLAGPSLRPQGLIFCFAYKYRGRFPVVADAVTAALGREPAPTLGAWRDAGMHLDDLSCCGDTCAC